MRELAKREDAPQFTDREFEELNKHIEADGPSIGTTTANNFLALYLEGQSIDQICKQFPHWPRGALLLARHVFRWDEQRDRYIEDMVSRLKERLVKVKVDVVDHLINTLAVAHKELAHDMAIYLQSPKPENLPKNRIKSHKEYKDVLATLQAALQLGQTEKGQGGQIPVMVNVNAAEGSTVQITSGEHSDALKQLANPKKE